MVRFHTNISELRRDILHILDLVPMSTSSVAPTFSIAAAYGVMVSLAGPQAIMSTLLTAIPFILISLIFRQFNVHFPHAGASYHWGVRVIGTRFGAFQAWVVTLAYFLSIPPIVVPAGEYTLALLGSLGLIPPSAVGEPSLVTVAGVIWALVAAIPLLLGAKPTARFTEAFLGMELVILGLFLVLGFSLMPHHVVNPFSPDWFFSTHVNWGGMVLGMVVATTIVDGWEIDSYSSEESKRPRRWPGLSGVIGLLTVLLVYGVTMPLMTVETPLAQLSQSVDPLATWASMVIPNYAWLMDVAVLASTASSLWLTAFILSRAWYAMARDGLLPKFFGWTHERFGSPWANVSFMTALVVLINVLILISPSVQQFFTLVLSAAGIFLALEFFLDSVCGIVFFWFKHEPTGRERLKSHVHWTYRLISVLSSLGLGSLIALGLYYSPSTIGYLFPEVFATLIGAGVIMVLLSRRIVVREFIAPD